MKYNVAVIGGGPGGLSAALKASEFGAKTILFEKEDLGGVCLNEGCIPTKTLLHSAKLFSKIKTSGDYGISAENPILDIKKLMLKKNNVIASLKSGINGLLMSHKIEIVKKAAHIIDSGHIEAGGEMYEAETIVLATGSVPVELPISIKNSKNIFYSGDLLSIEKMPETMTVIGGGVVGVEFAFIFAEFGCSVTIIELQSSLMANADKDVGNKLSDILKHKNIEVILNSKVKSIEDNIIKYEKDGIIKDIKTDAVLMSVGRKPGIDLETLNKLGIQNENGFIATNEFMQTSQKNIYAVGDAAGGDMLAHAASLEGVIAASAIMNRQINIKKNFNPKCVYISPEIAWIGMTENEAKLQGYDIVCGKSWVKANGRAACEGDAEGFVKVVADKEYGEILGVHMICPYAAELISQAVTAIGAELTVDEMAETIFAHPTVSETIAEAFGAAFKKL